MEISKEQVFAEFDSLGSLYDYVSKVEGKLKMNILIKPKGVLEIQDGESAK